MPTTDPTPIPVEALEAAIGATDRHYTAEFDGVIPVCRCGSREDDHDARVIVEAVAPILLAAGRTAAAADIRDHLARRGRLVGAFPPITPDAALRNKAVVEAYETAARVAENGADR